MQLLACDTDRARIRPIGCYGLDVWNMLKEKECSDYSPLYYCEEVMSLLMFSRLVNEPYTNVRRAVAILRLTPKRIGNTVSLSEAEAERLAVYLAERNERRQQDGSKDD